MKEMLCPYCGEHAELVGGHVVYPHRPDLRARWFWLCRPCGAYVGCHKGTISPLGRLANAELRAAKIVAHAAFDRLWNGTNLRRKDAYRMLAHRMGIPAEECHIGMFDAEQCRRVIDVCKTFLGDD